MTFGHSGHFSIARRRQFAYTSGVDTTINAPPSLPKWPFVLGDLFLLSLAALFVFEGPAPLGVWQGALALAAIGVGAWLCVWPFLREYQAALKLAEADALATTVAQIQHLEQITTQITSATADWQTVQEHSTKAVTAAKEIGDYMKTQLDEFCAFLRKASDAERTHLRLEVEKLRRGEGEWLQAAVHIFDHIFALHQAALRSGNEGLIAQLDQFQSACRDAVRRLGLASFAPALGESFDAQTHQLPEGEPKLDAPAQITEVLAQGCTFQGQLVRRALVRVQANNP